MIMSVEQITERLRALVLEEKRWLSARRQLEFELEAAKLKLSEVHALLRDAQDDLYKKLGDDHV